MTKVNFLGMAAAIILLSAFTINKSINWEISEGYSVKFSGTKVEGIFKDLKGSVQFNETNIEESKFSFTINVNSINTGNGMQNKHAVSDKWFAAETHPNITFNSKKVTTNANGYEVTGDMNIHGTTKEMTIPFTFGNNTFKSSFSVNRLDFGVGTMKGMSKKVSNQIDLEVSIPVTK